MESELLKQLTIESEVSNETIKRLKGKIEQLKALKNNEAITSLKEENRKLKEQVEELKKELLSLDGPIAAVQTPTPAPASTPAPAPVEQPKQQVKSNNEAKKTKEEKKPKSIF